MDLPQENSGSALSLYLDVDVSCTATICLSEPLTGQIIALHRAAPTGLIVRETEKDPSSLKLSRQNP